MKVQSKESLLFDPQKMLAQKRNRKKCVISKQDTSSTNWKVPCLVWKNKHDNRITLIPRQEKKKESESIENYFREKKYTSNKRTNTIKKLFEEGKCHVYS